MPRYLVSRDEVYGAIDSERAYQNKWNHAESEGNHSILEFSAFMEDYLGDVKRLQSRNAAENVKEESLNAIRKVTALGVACMEQHGAPCRKKFKIVNITLDDFEEDEYKVFQHPETLANMGVLVDNGTVINIDSLCSNLNGLTVAEAKHKLRFSYDIDLGTMQEIYYIIEGI